MTKRTIIFDQRGAWHVCLQAYADGTYGISRSHSCAFAMKDVRYVMSRAGAWRVFSEFTRLCVYEGAP